MGEAADVSAGTFLPKVGEMPRTVEIDIDVWTRIVFAAKESDDWKLRTLIEQAVMGPVPRA